MGLDFNVRCSEGTTPLSYAVVSGRKAVVKGLIDKDVDVNRPSNSGMTPLLLATFNKQEGIAETLLRVDGLDLDHLDRNRCSALGYAVKHDLKKTVELLKQKGATVCKYYGEDLEVE